jgi:hypothetical protein
MIMVDTLCAMYHYTNLNALEAGQIQGSQGGQCISIIVIYSYDRGHDYVAALNKR